MDVTIIATKSCIHRPNLEKALQNLNIPYALVYVEDQPELAAKLGIRHSPNLVVDGEVVFRHQPSDGELRQYIKR